MEQRIYQTLTIGIEHLKVERCDIKDMDLEHYYKLRTSLRDYGQLRNILVDASYNVMEGRKIAGVMRELGYKSIEVKIVPDDYIIPRLNLNSEYSTFDFVKVCIQLSKWFDLERKDHLKDVLPFKNVDIDDYIESLSFSFEKFNQQKNQQQGSLFGDMFTSAPEIKPAPVVEKKPIAPAPTLFGDQMELTGPEKVDIQINLPELAVTPEPIVVEPIKNDEPQPVVEETFADKRAREVREQEAIKNETNGSSEQDSVNDGQSNAAPEGHATPA